MFIGNVAAGVLAMPLGAFAQQQDKVWRIGFFYFGSHQSSLESGRYIAFVQGMRQLGYVEGKNLVIETRFGDGKMERLPDLATEMLRLRVDVIVATGGPVYSALQQAATTIPVVVTVTNDPTIVGLAASLSRPGGNFTGLTDTAENLGPKQLELLLEAVPQLARVGVLLNPDNASHRVQMKQLMLAAQKVRVRVVQARAGTVAGIEPAFAALVRERADAVILFGDTFFTQQFQQIAQGALKHRLPSISLAQDYAVAGGLMSYGADIADNFRRAAGYVDKILKGAKPGELPFEQPARYSLAINRKTATALGLAVSQSLLLRADAVIQ
jgi:putative ABC transport system substrate-binding protein